MPFLYSIGNKKIGRDTLIFNMGPASTCPSLRLGLCQLPPGVTCYAEKAERMYPRVLPYRRRQALYWRRTSAGNIAADILAALERHKRVQYVRVNESGDLGGAADVKKLFDIARRIPDVVFYMYTARRDLDLSRRPDNLIIQGSGFMVDNAYMAVREWPAGRVAKCPGNCRVCDLCKRARGVTIVNKYH